VQTKEHGRKLCVASSCKGVHGRIFYEHAFGFFIKIVILLRSTIGFISNFEQF
jgi:hypothetical protein